MKIKSTKRIISVFLLIIFFFFLIVSGIGIWLNYQKRSLFIRSNKSQLEESIQLSISQESEQQRITLVDYTFWDEMVDFIQVFDKKWVKENIDPMLETYNIDIVWIFDVEGNLKYSVHDTLKNFQKYVIEKSLLDSLYDGKLLHTYDRCPEGILELHAATVHPSNDADRKTPPRGYMIVGRLLDSLYLDNLSRLTGAQIALVKSNLEVEEAESDHSIAIDIELASYNDIPIGYLKVIKSFDFLRKYSQFSNEMIALYFLSMLFIVLSLLFVSIRWITKPLGLIEDILKTNDPKKTEGLTTYGSEFVEIGELITSFMNQKKILEQLKNKAEESDHLKSSFLANMSHEIRTPLNGIIGFSELLTKPDLKEEETTSYKRIIKNCSNDLLKIINDILDFSKIEAGQIDLDVHEFDVKDFVEDLIRQYSNKIYHLASKSVELRMLNTKSQITLNTDEQRLKQVLVNILNNAIKFTEKGSISLEVRVEDIRCIFIVQDSGIGIPEDQQSKIFERFYQAKKETSKLYGGTGLGLAISKKLVELMKGTIWFTSKERVGTTFYIALPISSLILIDHKSDRLDQLVIPDWKGKKVVLIEDNVYSSLLIKEYLDETSIEVIHFTNASSGIEHILKNNCDAILMDIRLSDEIDGLEATKRIRDEGITVPIIAQTASATEKETSEYEKIFSHGVLIKPIAESKVVEVLKKYGFL